MCGSSLPIVFLLLLNSGWFLWAVTRSCRYIDSWGRHYNGFLLVFSTVFYLVTGMFHKSNGCFVFLCNEFNVICPGTVCCCINTEYILKCDSSPYNGIFCWVLCFDKILWYHLKHMKFNNKIWYYFISSWKPLFQDPSEDVPLFQTWQKITKNDMNPFFRNKMQIFALANTPPPNPVTWCIVFIVYIIYSYSLFYFNRKWILGCNREAVQHVRGTNRHNRPLPGPPHPRPRCPVCRF